jgi:hypothetical protein
MGKKKKPKKLEQMHQHMKNGIPFGRAHLLNAEHKNEKTQKAHNDSLGDENG